MVVAAHLFVIYWLAIHSTFTLCQGLIFSPQQKCWEDSCLLSSLLVQNWSKNWPTHFCAGWLAEHAKYPGMFGTPSKIFWDVWYSIQNIWDVWYFMQNILGCLILHAKYPGMSCFHAKYLRISGTPCKMSMEMSENTK